MKFHASKYRILIVEDDLVDQMAVVRKLQQDAEAYQTLTADSLQDATNFLNTNTVNLIISDYHLPDGTAFDLPIDFNKTPLILITGNRMENFQSYIEKGAKEVLLKDHNLTYLKRLPSLIRSVLAKKNSPLQINYDEVVQHGLTKLKAVFGNDEKVVREIIQAFLVEGPANIKGMQLAFQEQDFVQLKELAHQLKSQFLMMGIPALSLQSANIEKLAGKDVGAIAGLLKKLEADSKTAFQHLKEYLTDPM